MLRPTKFTRQGEFEAASGILLTHSNCASLAEYAEKNEHSPTWDLSENDLGYAGIRSLCWLLKKNPGVTNLLLRRVGLCRRGMVLLRDMMMEGICIRRLDLSHNQLGEYVDIFCDFVSKTATLERLRIEYAYIDDTGIMELCRALVVNKSLQQLSLRGNAITSAGAGALATMLQTNTSLCVLDLRFTRIMNAGCVCLVDALAVNTTLKSLYIAETGITPAGTTSVFSALARSKALTVLDLSHADILVDRALDLRACMDSSMLTMLLLRNTLKDTPTVTWVLQALSCNTHIKFLNISSNVIDIDGCRAVGSFLAQNTAVEHLDLTECHINDEGMRAVGSGLAVNGKLQVLMCDDNVVGDAGAVHVCAALLENRSLRILTMDGTGFTPASRDLFAQTIKRVPNIEKVHVYNTDLSPSIRSTVKPMLQANTLRRQHIEQRVETLQTMVLTNMPAPALSMNMHNLIIKYMFL